MLDFWIKKNVISVLLKLLPVTLPATLADALMLFGIRSFVRLLGGDTDWTILEWFFSMILVVFLRFLFLKIRCEISENFFRRAGANLQGRFLKNLRTLRPDFFHKKEADACLRTAFEATEILPRSGESLYQTLQAFVQLLIFFPLLFWISTPLTLILFFGILPFVIFAQKKIRQMGFVEKETLLESGELRSEFEKARDVYFQWGDKAERKIVSLRVLEKIKGYFVAGKNLAIRKSSLALAIESVSVIAMLLVLAACAFLIAEGKMSGEDLVLYASAVFLCYKPIKECTRAFPQLRSASVAIQILKEFEGLPKRSAQRNFHGKVKLENVNFGYEGISVFKNFSMEQLLDSKKPLFLHGENGVGKSTLLRLLASLEEEESGNISLPNTPEKGVFFFSQNLFLPPIEMFEKKLRTRNLESKGVKVQEFFKVAEINTLIKKKGHSGGEKARLALILSLLSESKLLLLDEVLAYISTSKREVLLTSFLEAVEEEGKLLILSYHGALPESLNNRFKHAVLKKEEWGVAFEILQ